VLAGALKYLAENTHGAPIGYPHIDWPKDGPEPETDHEKWKADLLRWASVFENIENDNYFELHGENYAAWHADEIARYKAVEQALTEIIPWWGSLWD